MSAEGVDWKKPFKGEFVSPEQVAGNADKLSERRQKDKELKRQLGVVDGGTDGSQHSENGNKQFEI